MRRLPVKQRVHQQNQESQRQLLQRQWKRKAKLLLQHKLRLADQKLCGTYAIAGACERMYQHLAALEAQPPLCLLTGGAGWKMLPAMTRPFELVESLIFDGLLAIAAERQAALDALLAPPRAQKQPA